ncbi:hypothetical protein DFH06DRAFT_1194770 [Mycena polygramma]|nr:hypothetical protein DFH06DRAFT_1194770 [Mycena polygramma]
MLLLRSNTTFTNIDAQVGIGFLRALSIPRLDPPRRVQKLQIHWRSNVMNSRLTDPLSLKNRHSAQRQREKVPVRARRSTISHITSPRSWPSHPRVPFNMHPLLSSVHLAVRLASLPCFVPFFFSQYSSLRIMVPETRPHPSKGELRMASGRGIANYHPSSFAMIPGRSLQSQAAEQLGAYRYRAPLSLFVIPQISALAPRPTPTSSQRRYFIAISFPKLPMCFPSPCLCTHTRMNAADHADIMGQTVRYR